MNQINFSIERVSKEFNRRVIFKDISFALARRESIAITGRNGSGKSTLAKILCGLLSPSQGTIACSLDGRDLPKTRLYRHVGLVSPYLNMYDEFSGLENLTFFLHIRNLPAAMESEPNRLLEQFGIFERRNDEVRTYSSGMKQRLKYAAALLHKPEILILDEPTANLDAEGIAVVRHVMRKQTEQGILIVATNDADDLEFTQRCIDLSVLTRSVG